MNSLKTAKQDNVMGYEPLNFEQRVRIPFVPAGLKNIGNSKEYFMCF